MQQQTDSIPPRPEEIRICKKCNREMHCTWRKSHGKWEYRCFHCYSEKRRDSKATIEKPKEVHFCEHCGSDMRCYWAKSQTAWIYRCLTCKVDKNKRYYKGRKEREPSYRQTVYEKEKERDPLLATTTKLRRYGLTLDQYNTQLERQGGVCAVCGEAEQTTHQSGKIKQLAIDHNHITGELRGLLCLPCNCAIGYVKESPQRLRALADYLEKWQDRG